MTGPDTKNIIFIEVGKLAEFQKKQVAGKDQFTVVIDSDFQYGQKSADGTGRWIAFHNKTYAMYQVSASHSPITTACVLTTRLPP